eukprot:4074917-Amphidinium_carterae.1
MPPALNVAWVDVCGKLMPRERKSHLGYSTLQRGSRALAAKYHLHRNHYSTNTPTGQNASSYALQMQNQLFCFFWVKLSIPWLGGSVDFWGSHDACHRHKSIGAHLKEFPSKCSATGDMPV